jgi:hypothetical protein
MSVIPSDNVHQLTATDGETYPELTLVGWYTFGDEPVPWHMDMQMQFKKTIDGDQALFMLCHHDQLSESDSETKLPFTIYESFRQAGDGMEVDPPYESGVTKFRPITFASLETSPEEAVVLADVVQLASNASVVQPAPVSGPKPESKGKEKAVDAPEGESEPNYLTAEEEERKCARNWQGLSNVHQSSNHWPQKLLQSTC